MLEVFLVKMVLYLSKSVRNSKIEGLLNTSPSRKYESTAFIMMLCYIGVTTRSCESSAQLAQSVERGT